MNHSFVGFRLGLGLWSGLKFRVRVKLKVALQLG